MIESVKGTIKTIINEPVTNLVKCIIFLVIGVVLSVWADVWNSEDIIGSLIAIFFTTFIFGGAVYAFLYIPLKIHTFSLILMPVIFFIKAIIVVYGGWALLLATLILSIVGLVRKSKINTEQTPDEPMQQN